MDTFNKRRYPPLTPKEAIRQCRYSLNQSLYWLGKLEGFFFEPGEKEGRVPPEGE